MKRGIFIAIEGGEGCGKSTQTHFHGRPLNFHADVRTGYQSYFDKVHVPFTLIDASRSKEDVWKDVEAAVQSVLN